MTAGHLKSLKGIPILTDGYNQTITGISSLNSQVKEDLQVIGYMQAVLGAIELRQWLWFGVGAALAVLSDYLYNLLVCPVFNSKKIRLSVFCKAWVVYSGFVLFVTLFCRESSLQTTAAPVPLWSWVEVVANHDMGILHQILLNILLFVTFGGLLKMTFMKIRLSVGWLVGFGFSMAIELCQLVFHLGLFEWDDMLHNSLGCLIGCAVVSAVQAVRVRILQKSIW